MEALLPRHVPNYLLSNTAWNQQKNTIDAEPMRRKCMQPADRTRSERSQLTKLMSQGS